MSDARNIIYKRSRIVYAFLYSFNVLLKGIIYILIQQLEKISVATYEVTFTVIYNIFYTINIFFIQQVNTSIYLI